MNEASLVSNAQGTPEVSVLIAVHNGSPYLEEALRSIMQQTLRNIEIIVVDDCSTDDTLAVLVRLATEDPRIRIEILTENLRLPRALNRGLDLARAPLVARMDADDVAHPNRLAVQKKFMDNNPDVVLSGTSFRQVDGEGHIIRTSFRPRDAFATRWTARFHMPLTHPTFMFRNPMNGRQALYYDPQFKVAQDYDFMVRAMHHGAAVSLPDILLDYRVHGSSLTGKNWGEQNENMSRIAAAHIERDLDAAVAAALGPMRAAFYTQTLEDVPALFAGMRKMILADMAKNPEFGLRERRWMRRQSAQMIVRALQRARVSHQGILTAFLAHGRDFLPDLAMRLLEIKRLLPAALRSDPDI